MPFPDFVLHFLHNLSHRFKFFSYKTSVKAVSTAKYTRIFWEKS